jgi:FeS assembly SUF system protein
MAHYVQCIKWEKRKGDNRIMFNKSVKSQINTVNQPHNAELNKQQVEEKIIQVLKTCYDPEIPVDIFELGLIYEIRIDDSPRNNKVNVNIKMTLTSPACPVAGSLPGEVESKVRSVEEVSDVKVEIVWNPPWDKEMMSDVAKVELGFM